MALLATSVEIEIEFVASHVSGLFNQGKTKEGVDMIDLSQAMSRFKAEADEHRHKMEEAEDGLKKLNEFVNTFPGIFTISGIKKRPVGVVMARKKPSSKLINENGSGPKKWPYGKPNSMGGNKTNYEIIRNYLMKCGTARYAGIARDTGLMPHTVSATMSNKKKIFINDGDGNWSVKG
jgi:hypothetical protein